MIQKNKIDRRNFLRQLGGTGIGLLLSPFFPLFSYEKDYQEQMAFLQEVKVFAQKALGMNIGDFYRKWSRRPKERINFLYVSLPDKIERPPDVEHNFLGFGKDYERALEKQKTYSDQGFHTLLYQTAGASNVQLNYSLLSYPYHTIAFIAFHEALHIHRGRSKASIPYIIEEAACDIVGNYAALQMSYKSERIGQTLIARQIQLHENIYETINSYTQKIRQCSGDKKQQKTLHWECKKQLLPLLSKGNRFHRDRFDYPINNAYFFRNQFYFKHYFLLKQVYQKTGSLRQFIQYILTLPEEEAPALEQIEQKLR